MKKSIRIKNIILIIIMILMVVITVFPSCSAEDTLPILVNIKIKEDEESYKTTLKIKLQTTGIEIEDNGITSIVIGIFSIAL